MFKSKLSKLIVSGFLLLLSLGCNKLSQKTADRPSPPDSIPSLSSLQPTSSSPDILPSEVPLQILEEEISPEASEIQKLKVRIWQYLYDNRYELGVCDGDNNFYVFKYYPLIYKVSSGRYLVELVCNKGGLHNGVEYFLYHLRSGKPQVTRLSLDRFVKDESGNFTRQTFSSIAGSTKYDPEQQILSVFSRAIRVATCGSFARYKLEGYRFGLLEYRYQECQSGNITVLPPEQYPQIYP